MTEQAENRPWLRAALWFAFLGPFFFLTYNFANAAADSRSHVATIAFSWERHIPFLAWTILPYWSSDLLYALSLFVCRTRKELDLHGKRLLAIQLFCVACFLAFPLRCTFERPPVGGWEGSLFSTLLQFDRPFNQAPSLHAGLAVILWARYREHVSGPMRPVLAGWLMLVSLSTLTTYQHQFIDVPTGAWAGLLALAALPERRVARPQVPLTLAYLSGTVALMVAAFALRGYGWLLLWPAFALSMAAAAYWTGDAAWLAQRGAGPALLLLPYTVSAWLHSRIRTRHESPRNYLADGVWVGRAPSKRDRLGINSVVSLASELRIRADEQVAMLDLVPPSVDQLDAAVAGIERLADRRPTLVNCALGYSRSAITAAAWLISAGHAAGPEDAVEIVRRARPQVVLRPGSIRCLEQWFESRGKSAPEPVLR